MKIIFILLALLTSLSIYAQSENQSVEKVTSETHHHTKNSDFTLEFVLASEQVKSSSDHESIGQYTSLKNSLTYSATPNDDLRLYVSVVNENYDTYPDQNYFEFGELMYRRKGILTEDQHGVNLDFELKNGFVLDDDIRRLWAFDGETIPQLVFKKHLPNSTGVEFKARHHYYHRNKKSKGALFSEDRLFLSGYKMFNHAFIFNTELKYRHKVYTGKHYSYERNAYENQNVEDLVIRPSLMYFVSRQALLEGYLESKINVSYDDRNIGKVLKDELIVGGALYFTAF